MQQYNIRFFMRASYQYQKTIMRDQYIITLTNTVWLEQLHNNISILSPSPFLHVFLYISIPSWTFSYFWRIFFLPHSVVSVSQMSLLFFSWMWLLSSAIPPWLIVINDFLPSCRLSPSQLPYDYLFTISLSFQLVICIP